MPFTVAIVRNTTQSTIETFSKHLPEGWSERNALPDFIDTYFANAFEFPKLPVLKFNSIEMCQWGLIPNWCTNDYIANDIRNKTLNADGEIIFERPLFCEYAMSQRCILAVDGFYEWHNLKGVKYPFYIYPKDQSGFLIGAVYNKWVNPQTDQMRNTFSIVTTAANPLMESINNQKKRMPLILSMPDAAQWINDQTELDTVKSLIKPYDEQLMKAHTISKIVNSSLNFLNTPEIQDEVIYPELKNIG